MAAVIQIRRWTGPSATPTKTVITASNNRLSASDNPDPIANTPIPIPQVGTNYSYWSCVRLYCSSPPLSQINNILCFSDGISFGTGLVCGANQATAYRQANGTYAVTGTVLNTSTSDRHYNFAGTATSPLVGAPIDISTITQSSPLFISGDLSGGQTGDFGNFFVYQLAVGVGASLGNIGSHEIFYSWDEV